MNAILKPNTKGGSTKLSSLVENSAKPGLKRMARFMVEYDPVWRVVGANLTRFGLYLASQRDEEERKRIVKNHPALSKALEPSRILAGPFAGLDYSGVPSFCSAKYPKLLGTYEFELHQVLKRLLSTPQARIVNVGAADGFYAVGLARFFPEAHMLVYEADPRGRASLEKLSSLNGVDARIEIHGRCEPEDIVKLPNNCGLMVIDCEGYEQFLITSETVSSLFNTTLLIETHDGYLPGITSRLAEILSGTHDVVTVEAVHDLNRADVIEVPEILRDLTRGEVDRLLAETRTHACLRWLVAHPKKR